MQGVAAAYAHFRVVQLVSAVIVNPHLQHAATATLSDGVVHLVSAALGVVGSVEGDTVAAYLLKAVVGHGPTASGVVGPRQPVPLAAYLVAVIYLRSRSTACHARCQLVDGDAVLFQVSVDVGTRCRDVGCDLLAVPGGVRRLVVKRAFAAQLRHRVVGRGSATVGIIGSILRGCKTRVFTVKLFTIMITQRQMLGITKTIVK